MTRTRPDSARALRELPSQTEWRAVKYVAAAGAGLLAASVPACADIIYEPENITLLPRHAVSFGFPGGQFVMFNTFFASSAAIGFIGMRGYGGGILASGSAAAGLPKGFAIGPGGGFRQSVSVAYALSSSEVGYYRRGNFFGGAKYAGLELTIGGSEHFGWLRISTSGNHARLRAKITGFAYETIANTPILAGDTGTPEPASLGLLALGAAGLACWRKMRPRAPEPPSNPVPLS